MLGLDVSNYRLDQGDPSRGGSGAIRAHRQSVRSFYVLRPILANFWIAPLVIFSNRLISLVSSAWFSAVWCRDKALAGLRAHRCLSQVSDLAQCRRNDLSAL